ncbi:hypothetical protein LV457_11640 [Mycobacterium sp. MYCO198283]|uniref:hypothetical protein n=1 Tax=Mycobacterium sp. MYCO198283 TaxID=2883505 RepID=UPI001E2B0B0D|nr:hypothetical protein [Mycobacterium sp. MYCO198283]MCG5432935.1 hypothetical protein [Mycobacterium sp. MYCO198283]
MTTTPPTSHDVPPAWGAPPAAPNGWSRKTTLAAAGIAVVLAAGGGAVIYAATRDDATHAGMEPGMGGGQGMAPPGAAGQGGPGMRSGGPGMGPDPGMGPGGGEPPLHGEFVVADGNGGYRTTVTQTGTLTAVTDTSITAKSEDDYTRTYVLDTSTQTRSRDRLQVGDTAAITATVTDGNAVATTVAEMG